MPTTAFVKPSRLRAAVRRHPWIYGDSVQRVEGDYENGDAVVVRAPDGRFVAHGFINDASRLFLRLVSFDKQAPLNDELLRARVRDALRLRRDLLNLPARADAYRLIHSEADGLPGLIVDRYGDALVYSCSSLGTYRRLEPILAELRAQLTPQAIVELGVSEGLRGSEGLPEGRGLLEGELPEPLVVTIDGLRLEAPLLSGQKTGLFLDQRENVRRVAELARGRSMLDVCCYGGAFGLAGLRAGARACVFVDASQDALDLAARNAERNEVNEGVAFRAGSLFRELRALADAAQRFELIVLDPPKFAKSARQVRKARKGYFNANLLALRLLAPGGLLLTCSCSHHVSTPMLEEVVAEAAGRAGVALRVLERRGAGADHPVDVQCPEGRYLKALLLQARA